jgi:hypothetical protein
MARHLTEPDDLDCGCAACAADPTISASSVGHAPAARGAKPKKKRKPY